MRQASASFQLQLFCGNFSFSFFNIFSPRALSLSLPFEIVDRTCCCYSSKEEAKEEDEGESGRLFDQYVACTLLVVIISQRKRSRKGCFSLFLHVSLFSTYPLSVSPLSSLSSSADISCYVFCLHWLLQPL
jgi:hypothetical protein